MNRARAERAAGAVAAATRRPSITASQPRRRRDPPPPRRSRAAAATRRRRVVAAAPSQPPPAPPARAYLERHIAAGHRESASRWIATPLRRRYPIARRPRPRPPPDPKRAAAPPEQPPKTVWRVRTLAGAEAVLPARRAALVAAAKLRPTRDQGDAADDARFYLHDAAASPLDLELPAGDDASGSEPSDDETPPRAKRVVDRAWLEARAEKVGSLLKRSEDDPNLWRRRTCVLVNDRLWSVRRADEIAATPRRGRG